jgi:hypothetical protein
VARPWIARWSRPLTAAAVVVLTASVIFVAIEEDAALKGDVTNGPLDTRVATTPAELRAEAPMAGPVPAKPDLGPVEVAGGIVQDPPRAAKRTAAPERDHAAASALVMAEPKAGAPVSSPEGRIEPVRERPEDATEQRPSIAPDDRRPPKAAPVIPPVVAPPAPGVPLVAPRPPAAPVVVAQAPLEPAPAPTEKLAASSRVVATPAPAAAPAPQSPPITAPHGFAAATTPALESNAVLGALAKKERAETAGRASAPTVKPAFSFSGGDGRDCDAAIAIGGASDVHEFAAAQSAWLTARHPGGQVRERKRETRGARTFELVDFTTPDGKSRSACFEVTGLLAKP